MDRPFLSYPAISPYGGAVGICQKEGSSLREKRRQPGNERPILPVIVALVLVVASVGYIVQRVLSDRAYNEKWKDYYECGI